MANLVLTRICSIDNCNKSVHARNLCPMHYRRWRLTGTTDRDFQARRCCVDGCDNKHYGHGYCFRHAREFKGFGPSLTQEELKRVLSYDPDTGVFVWNRREYSNSRNLAWWNDKFAGKEAGRIISHEPPYRQITVFRKVYSAQRLAWFYMTGVWPEKFVDHRNRNSLDNRWRNLREATNAQNQHNSGMNIKNKTGFKGVHFDKKYNKFKANISHNKKTVYLGSYDTPEAAHKAYCKAARDLRGEFANFGNGDENVSE